VKAIVDENSSNGFLAPFGGCVREDEAFKRGFVAMKPPKEALPRKTR